MPLAIIMETGIIIKTSSEPFLAGSNNKNKVTIAKLAINKYQLFLNVLLTAIVAIDLITIENNETVKILARSQMYLGLL